MIRWVAALAAMAMQIGATAMASEATVFSAIDRLVAERGRPAASIEALVQARLVRDAARSTPFFTVYEAKLPPGRPFAGIELRASANPKIDAGMMILSRDDHLCVASDAVIARYGNDFALSPPLAGAPADSPTYYAYRRDWGALRFGFAPGRPECLVRVVIDWTG